MCMCVHAQEHGATDTFVMAQSERSPGKGRPLESGRTALRMLLIARRAAIWNQIWPEDQSEVRFGGFGDLAPCLTFYKPISVGFWWFLEKRWRGLG